jgi:DNA-binding CsgD family transcriptional regulator
MSWDFVGRVDELEALESGWLAAGAGRVAPVAVVYGEPGIGKTRTVAELAEAVRARGAEVLWGTCYEGGGSRPYAVWAEAIRGYVERLGGDRLGAALGGEARWLAPLLADAAPGNGSSHVPAEVARVRLAEVLVRVLDSFDRPPLLVLDDMQWAYPESLELFGHVARLATGSLVVCCRGSGLDLGHPLAQRLAEVQRQRECEYVPLTSLSRKDAAALLEQAAGGPLDNALVDAVYDESGGNPFFLGELGRHLHRDRPPDPVRGLPESIRAAVGLRLSGLSAQARHVLALASVFTAGFGFAELQALSEAEEASLLDCLEQALVEELVCPVEGERYDFAHALIRQTLYERLSPSRRARLHRRLAEVLERLHQADPAQVAAELVHQYHASATLPGAERGATHALTAAQAARRAGAPADAVVILRLGLDLVPAEDLQTRAKVLGELARAEAEAGLTEEAPRTLEAAITLLERLRTSGEAIAELVYEVGVAFAFAVAPRGFQAIEPLIGRGMDAVGQARSLAWARLRLLDCVAQSEGFGLMRVVRPVHLDPEAVRIARSEGTEADYAFTLAGWDPVLGAKAEQLIARIEGWQDPVARLRALMVVLGHLALVEPGDARFAENLSTELVELADDLGLPPHRALARVLTAALLGRRGEFDAAAEQISKARAVFEHVRAAGAIPGVVIFVEELTAQHVAVDWPRLAETMWDLARRPKEPRWLSLPCAGFAAQGFACAGDVKRARDVLGAVLPALESAEPFAPTNSSAVGLAGAAVWELGADDLARQLLPRALALAEADGPDFYMTSTELTVARLSAVLDRFDDAVYYFERARKKLERHGQWVLRAIADYDEAVVRAAHRQPGGAKLLAVARLRFHELGMREWSKRAASFKLVDDELPDRLTTREAEILRLVARRRTNKEIAAELIVSVHTVERHVQNAYRKIGARSRADAGTYVTRVDL